MIYAYDKNMQMPTMDLYDTLIMAMAVKAAKDEYDAALKRIEEFYDKYGDFSTPFKKDQQRYDEIVTGRINKLIDDIYARGGDPLRNAQDRNEVRRELRRLPINEINQMKRNAKIGEVYLQNAAKLAQENRFNADMSAWEDGDFENFSTVGDNGALNVWGKSSPSAYQNIDQLLEPVVSNVKLTYDPVRTKADKGSGRIWKTISLPRLMAQFNDSMSDILSTPSGQYLLAQSLKEADIINKLHPGSNITGMDVLKNKAENRLRDHVQEEFSYDPMYMENQKYRHALSIANAKNKQEDPKIQYTTRVGSVINNRFNNNLRGVIMDFINESEKTAAILEKRGRKPKYGTEYYKKLKEDLNGDDPEKALIKARLIDEFGNVDSRIVNYAKDKYARNKNGGKYWGLRSYTPSSSYEREMYRTMAAGSDSKSKVMGEDLYTMFSGPNTGVVYAPYRYASVVGGTKQLSDIEKVFASWFSSKNMYGYLENGVNRMAQIPQKGVNYTDFDGKMFISDEDFEDFINSTKDNSALAMSGKKDEIAGSLGITKRIDNTFETPETYWSVPIVRSYDVIPDDMNAQYDKSTYGVSNAGEERNEALGEALDFYLK